MAGCSRGRIVQVTNISPSSSLEQMRTLFGHIGIIEEIVLYPAEKEETQSKVCYIKYAELVSAEVALHLNNTMFLDRSLIVLPLVDARETIPDEKYANLMKAPANTAAGILPRSADWPLDVISMVVGRPGEQAIHTIEPRLSSLGFPVYPPLPAATDVNRIEEIRRTVLVTNIGPKTSGEEILNFFNAHAEVKCVRMAGTDDERAAYVEFTEQPSIIKAFGLMGATVGDRQIMIQHSNNSIIKPASALPGINHTVRKVSPPPNPLLNDSDSKQLRPLEQSGMSSRRSDRGRSRSHSKSKDRSRRSRSPRSSHRSRSRSRHRSRDRRASRHHRSRSRSRSRRRQRRSRSRSRDRKRETRDRSRSRHRRSRKSRSPSDRKRRHSRSRSKGRRERRDGDSRKRSRDRDRTKRDRSREHAGDKSREDRPREKDRNHDRDKVRDHEKDRSQKHEKDKEREKTKKSEKSSKIRKSRSKSKEKTTEKKSSSKSDKVGGESVISKEEKKASNQDKVISATKENSTLNDDVPPLSNGCKDSNPVNVSSTPEASNCEAVESPREEVHSPSNSSDVKSDSCDDMEVDQLPGSNESKKSPITTPPPGSHSPSVTVQADA